MAEEIEKRFEVIEEGMTQRRVVEHQILDIVQETDHKVDALTGAVRSVQAHNAIVNARLDALAVDMVMKEDIANMATKSDLERTKNEILDAIKQLIAKPTE